MPKEKISTKFTQTPKNWCAGLASILAIASVFVFALTLTVSAQTTLTNTTITVGAATDDQIAFDPVAAGAASFTGTITSVDLTAARTWTLPNATGEISLLGQTIESAEITDATIVNADINANAAIAYSKLNLTNSIVSADIADGTIVDADVAAAFTRDTEWDTAAEINAATTDADFLILTGGTMTGALVLDDTSLQIQEGVDAMTITVPALTAARAVTFPDAAGEVSLLGQTIESAEITDGTIDTADIANDAVKTQNIKGGHVYANKLQNAARDLGAADVTVNFGNTNGAFNTNITTDGILTAGTLTDGTFSVTGGTVTGVTMGGTLNMAGQNISNIGDINSVNSLNMNGNTISNVALTSATITSPKIVANILDTNAATILGLASAGTAVNYLLLGNAATGNDVGLTALGTDANIGLSLQTKGTNSVTIRNDVATDDKLLLKPAAGGAASKKGTITSADLTGSQTWTFPDATGTIVVSGGLTASNAANQVCLTTCAGSTCLIGYDNGAGNFVACTDAAADSCLCATP